MYPFLSSVGGERGEGNNQFQNFEKNFLYQSYKKFQLWEADIISPKASACHCMICEHNKGSSWLISGAFWLIYLVDHFSGCHLSVLTLKPIWIFYFLTSSFYYTQLDQIHIQIKCPKINRCLLRSLKNETGGSGRSKILLLSYMISPNTWGYKDSEVQDIARFLLAGGSEMETWS